MISNSADPDQTASYKEQSDHGQDCLPKFEVFQYLPLQQWYLCNIQHPGETTC